MQFDAFFGPTDLCLALPDCGFPILIFDIVGFIKSGSAGVFYSQVLPPGALSLQTEQLRKLAKLGSLFFDEAYGARSLISDEPPLARSSYSVLDAWHLAPGGHRCGRCRRRMRIAKPQLRLHRQLSHRLHIFLRFWFPLHDPPHLDLITRLDPIKQYVFAGRERHAHRAHAYDLTPGVAEIVDRLVLDDELRPGLARLRHGNHFASDEINLGVARRPCGLLVPLPARAARRNDRAEHRNDSKGSHHPLLSRVNTNSR
jgi:hypothetical protein